MYRAQGGVAGMRGGPRKSANPTNDLKVLVAVDFGTTFSGVAYASTLEPETQNVLVDWGPGLHGEKVPSVLKYEGDDIYQSFEWGFQAQSGQQPGVRLYQWFKLRLDPAALAAHAAESDLLGLYPTALPQVTLRQCEKLVIDYLKSLKGAISRYFSNDLPRELSEVPHEYIITVPAMWSEAAQEATKGCAAEAFLGNRHRIDEIRIIAEPEAAGIYALAKMPKIGLKKGDTFVICDAGGGTVDLSSYRINSLSPSHIGIEGRSTPSGGFCGSSFLNRIFEDYLLNYKLAGYIQPSNPVHMRWLKSAVDRDFEDSIKPSFTGDPNRTHYIDAFCFMQPSRQHGVQDNTVELTGREIRDNVFDVVVSRICTLVSEQIAKTRDPVKAVLLAGGFGQNAYLRDRIENTVDQDVQVLQIDHCRTSIVQGALIDGLSRAARLPGGRSQSSHLGLSHPEDPGRIFQRVHFVTVSSRLSPKHYGVAVDEEYDATKEVHRRGRSKRRRGQPGKPDSIEVIKWFVRKDDQIEEGEPKSFDMYYDKEVRGTRPPTIECRVYASEANEPPNFPDDPSLAGPLLTLTVDLSDIPDLPTKEVAGRTYYHVEFEIYMTLRSADLEFVLGRGSTMYKPQRVKFSRIYADE